MIGFYEIMKWNEMSKCRDMMKWDEKISGNMIKWDMTHEGWVKVKNGRKWNCLRFKGYEVECQLLRFKSHKMNGWKWKEMEDGKRWCSESEEMECDEIKLFEIRKPCKAEDDVEWKGECMKSNALVWML